MELRVNLTRNFILSEFIRSNVAAMNQCRDQFNVDVKTINAIQQLCINVLQPIRDAMGTVTITSGYRCDFLNNLVGGVPNSQHKEGKAADFYCRDNKKAIEIIRNLPFDQMVIYPNYIHVSYDKELSRRQIIDKR